MKHNNFNNNTLTEIPTNDSATTYATDATYKDSINITNAKSTKFQLSLTWQYDENLVELFLQAAGFSAKQIKQVWFGKANHMQSYLLRPDFFAEVNGMLDDADKPVATRTTVPRLNDGSQLQAWALAKGLPVAPVGFSTTQYYQLLCNAVERRR